MQQHIGLRGFFQRGGKCRNQFVRQIADESDGIGQDNAAFGTDVQPPCRGVECGEQLVFRIYARLGQPVEQAGFADIGIADQRKRFDSARFAGLAAQRALFFEAGKLFFQDINPMGDQSAVGFQFGFARAFHADTASLALQMSVTAYQASRQMAQLRQLDLQPAFLSAGATGENRQNQPYPVQYAALEDFFQIAFLRGRKFVVEYDQIDAVCGNCFRQLRRLARADKQRGVRTVAFGGLHNDGIAACRFDQLDGFRQCRLKTVQTGGTAARTVFVQHYAHQHDAFRLRLGTAVAACSACHVFNPVNKG